MYALAIPSRPGQRHRSRHPPFCKRSRRVPIRRCLSRSSKLERELRPIEHAQVEYRVATRRIES